MTGSNPPPAEYDKNVSFMTEKAITTQNRTWRETGGPSISEDRALGLEERPHQGGSPGSNLAHLWKLSTILRWTRRSFLVR